MLSKLFVFGAGYVLGTKAGRERYNQIAALAQEAAKRLDGLGTRDQFSSGSSWSSTRMDARRSGPNKV